MVHKDDILTWLKKTRGVLTSTNTIVCRESYSGNDVIAKNSSKEYADERGYLPVEHWIMSTVESQSRLAYPGEGITKIKINAETVTLRDLVAVAEDTLFGSHFKNWPLGKILDIGGTPVKSSFGTTEVPPGAVEVHRGVIVDGRAVGPGKLEAYFYPPTDVQKDALLRLGLKPSVAKEDVYSALLKFGIDDSMYTLLNEYKVEPMTGWTIPAGVVHSAAAYVTFEIQVPQDGYNAATWKFGQRLEGEERLKAYQAKALKGLVDEKAYVEQLIDWELSTSTKLPETYRHLPKVLSEGSWGRRYQVFYGTFYGEGWEVAPGASMVIPATEVPVGGVVWTGKGTLNGNEIARSGMNEFLITPHTNVELVNDSDTPLILYTFEPLRP